MPIDPRIPLMGQPAPIQSPFEAMSAAAQFQAVREQSEARRLAAEEARQKRTRQQQIDRAYEQAVKVDPQTGRVTVDRQVLLGHLPGSLVPGLMKQIDDDEQSVLNLQTATLNLAKARQAHLGSAAQTVIAAQGDPTIWGVELKGAHKMELIDDDTYEQLSALTDPKQILAIAQSFVARAGGKADEGFTLSEGQVRYGPGGTVIATGPAKAPPPDTGFTLTPGGMRFDASGNVVASVPAAPGSAAGGFTLSPGAVRYDAAGNVIASRPPAPGEAGGVKLSAGAQDDLATMATVQDLSASALKLGDQIHWRGTGPVGGRIGAWGAQFGAGGEDPERLRNLLGNIQGTIAKLRGGTAFSAQEQAMLERYTPTALDSVLQIKAKLKSLDEFIVAKRKNTLAVAAGQLTPSAAPPAGGAGGARKPGPNPFAKK